MKHYNLGNHDQEASLMFTQVIPQTIDLKIENLYESKPAMVFQSVL
jgi:hypothetical protein